MSQLYLAVAGITFALLFQLYRYARSSSPHPPKSLKISQIYVYPIKSLRTTPVTSALATRHGFQHDRVFMLRKITPEGHQNMTVGHFPEMTRFLTLMKLDESGNGSIEVTFKPGDQSSHTRTLEIPLSPDIQKLEPIDINMHGSPTKAFQMQDLYNKWFSECFGYQVELAYLGDNKRGILFQDMLAPSPNTWLPSSMAKKSALPEKPAITFADCAPYLVVSATSLNDVSARLPDGVEMDVSKFRPNIVLEGADGPWEEDYWRRIKIGPMELVMMHNCVRCRSINIDYKTGTFGTGDSDEVLKKLQKDRRVDGGAKWSPVFGRYSFWGSSKRVPAQMLRVKDDVHVVEVNDERTTWSWPDIS
ncbi:MOSC-domain-containing protein [Periconia macrospinosa]|uniref:MOSC-domain-containing protein n=1 Tax=Periconia macrospinosa TaxID=97972 RepID=A0A2V1D8G0_9PLEO|nr:MOSC-domain-containing protein [Periconia macrospinosa]